MIIKGNNQIIELSKDSNLSITFSFDYYLFKESGKLFIDGKEVSKDKYSISKGSTIITINNSYLNTLQKGEHSIVAKMNDKEVEGNFTISNTNKVNKDSIESNPKTGDNITFYITVLGVSIIGLIGAGLYFKKKKKEIIN